MGALMLTSCASTPAPVPAVANDAPTSPQVPTSAPLATPTPTPTPDAGPELKQASVVDGDTIKVGGQSIRIIGVDTPERGECGFSDASDLTRSLTAGGVVLVKSPTTDNKDNYDRLLRFVTTSKGQDVGKQLIRAGLANARYDSKDGYDTHKFETAYHKLDSTKTHKCPTLDSSHSASPKPKAAAGSGGNCDPNYGGSCVPLSTSDLNCPDISGPVTVLGSDPHGFDRDGDGTGCDSN